MNKLNKHLTVLRKELKAADALEQLTRRSIMSRRWFVRSLGVATGAVALGLLENANAGTCVTNTVGCSGSNSCTTNSCNSGTKNTCDPNTCGAGGNTCNSGGANTCTHQNQCLQSNQCGCSPYQGDSGGGGGNTCAPNECDNGNPCTNTCNPNTCYPQNLCSSSGNTCTGGDTVCPQGNIYA